MKQPTRREMLKYGAATCTMFSHASRSVQAGGANQQINLGIIGCGGRAKQLVPAFETLEGVHLAAFCDPDRSRLDMAAKEFPKAYVTTDLRRLLDSPDIDAVVIAACNHWHALASIWAMDAGKHVYVEKPLGHQSWDGRQTVNAAKRYGKICQVGTQQRSDPMQAQLKRFLHQDQSIGAVRSVFVNRFDLRGSIGKREQPLEIPEAVDYDMWLGPAEEQPIYRDSLQYDWHWDWNTGSGEMGNWGVHIVDDVRNVAFQDRIAYPRTVISGGGRLAWNDAGDTPNIQFAWLNADGVPVLIRVCNIPAKPDAKAPPAPGGPSTGYVVHCEGGWLEGRRGGAVAFDANGKEMRRFHGDSGDGHQRNFIDAIRQNAPDILAAPVETGHHSTEWCNLANAAFRVGAASPETDRTIGHLTDEVPEMDAALRQIEEVAAAYRGSGSADRFVVGPMLTFDSGSERFVGPESEAGNKWLRRSDRKGFEVPEVSVET